MLRLGIDQDIFCIKQNYSAGTSGDVAIFKLDETGGNGEASLDSNMQTNWLQFNNNPQQEKRLIEVKIRYKNNGTNTIAKVFKDSSGSATFTSASLDSSNTEQITYIRDASGNNPSMSGKVFQLQLYEDAPATPATTLELYEVEFQYEVMGNR
jgi:hypothetical protein